jgi:hypothetical protein
MRYANLPAGAHERKTHLHCYSHVTVCFCLQKTGQELTLEMSCAASGLIKLREFYPSLDSARAPDDSFFHTEMTQNCPAVWAVRRQVRRSRLRLHEGG